MPIVIGEAGSKEADLLIAQSTTFEFTVEHTDSSGGPVSHEGAVPHLHIRKKGGDVSDDYVLDETVSFPEDGLIFVSVPPSVTKTIPVGSKYLWDLMIELPGGRVNRLLYGKAEIVDTYSMDGE